VWRWQQGQVILPSFPLDNYCHYAFSPDSRQLALGRANAVILIDLTTGREQKSWPLPAPPAMLAFHPGGRQLAIGYRDGTDKVSVYDATTGRLNTELPVGPILSAVVAWHPDGTRLAVGSADPRTQIWDVTTKRRLTTLEGHVQSVTHVTFHPTGELVATR